MHILNMKIILNFSYNHHGFYSLNMVFQNINKYDKTGEDRTYINLPLETNDETLSFIEYFQNLDNQFDSSEFRKSMKINDKYTYIPIIKQNDNTPSIKIKFKT